MKNKECQYGDAIPTLTVAMEYIKKELWEIKDDLKQHIAEEDTMMHRIEEKFTAWMNESDKRFASKQTETIVQALLAMIFLWMAGTILTMIFQHVWLQ